VGRAAKVLAVVDDLGIEGWEWLRDIREIVRKKKSGFMEDVPAGRPILCFPSRRGGFRLRYGRSRNTGLSAVAVHPLTMMTLQNFLAGGTQLKIETPSKSGVVLPVDAIETPIVRLKDGSVVQVSYENFDRIKDQIEKILFLGDLLVCFGDFLYNSKNLLPSGYTEEWWREEVWSAIASRFNENMGEAAAKAEVPIDSLEGYLQDPFKSKPCATEAIRLSQALDVPLHPHYTYFWSAISPKELLEIRSWLLSSEVKVEKDRVIEVRGAVRDPVKVLLEKILVPHKVSEGQILMEGDEAHSFAFTVGFHSLNKQVFDERSTLENLARLSGIAIRDKAPVFIGARVGRPEKASRREMKPVVQVLFPIGLNGGPQRDLMKAYEKGVIHVDIVKRSCPTCKVTTFGTICSICGSQTILGLICPK